MNDCLFCKIAAGDIPSTRVFEDDLCVAFMDIGPVVRGHVLVIPRAHHAGITVTPSDLAAHLLDVARRIGLAQKKALGAAGINIFTNDGALAGQSVFHTHFHVIPQFADDRHVWNWEARPYASPADAKDLADRIAAAL